MKISFIDFENTKSTCSEMLGFEVDLQRLAEYLINDLSCDFVYLYTGVESEDFETILKNNNLMEENKKIKIVMKPYKKYFKKDKVINKTCSFCGKEHIYNIKMGADWKANCDVDMAMDITKNILQNNIEKIYIFTADGDFYPVIKLATEHAKKVYIVADATKKVINNFTMSRFSTRLRKLLAEKRENLSMMNLVDLKLKIRKIKQPYGPAVLKDK
jgi:uncharacterized protein (TIGR00288 family)